MAGPDSSGYWGKTKKLALITLAIWALFAFVIHFLAVSLNGIAVLGFPIGFYMAAQGSLIAFVILTFWFAARQDAIDREYGVAEDD